MATAFCTFLAFGGGVACAGARLASSPCSARVLPWTLASLGFFGFAWWGVWEMAT